MAGRGPGRTGRRTRREDRPGDPGPGVIDLNADLGESFGAWRLGDDEALLAHRHQREHRLRLPRGRPADDPARLRGAVAHQVSIGAQVSYRDLAGFGRRNMDVPADELTAEVLYQIAALDGIARAEGGRASYVKPHGALYHRAAADPVQAVALAAAISAYDPGLPLLTLPDGEAARAAAAAGLTVVAEGFADRAYRADGTLVPRGQPGAVISDPARAAARAAGIATSHAVRAADGQDVKVSIRSLCVHGDTPGRGHARARGPGGARAGRGACSGVRVMRARPGRARPGRARRAACARRDAALLLQADGPAGGLAAAIVSERIAGVLDVIPGAGTVLVTTEPGRLDLGELAAPGAGPAAARGRPRRRGAGRDPRGLRRAGPGRGGPADRAVRRPRWPPGTRPATTRSAGWASPPASAT